mgnify:FL=1
MTRKTTLATAALIAAANAANAQPFVLQHGEARESLEYGTDLTRLANGNFAYTGGLADPDLQPVRAGYTVTAAPDGTPLASWITVDPDAITNPGLAIRQDPNDGRFIILQNGNIFTANPDDLVLLKLDPAADAINWQWRYRGSNPTQAAIGMELTPETGFIAHTIESGLVPQTPALLRFANNTGLPLFHNQYLPVNVPAADATFVDVTLNPDTGDVFAVGTIDVDEPDTLLPGRDILIARFDSAGNPIWFRAYDAPPPGDPTTFTTFDGVGIELDQNGDPIVTANANTQGRPTAVFHLTVNDTDGAPINGRFLIADGGPLEAARSSLEPLNQQSALIAGRLTTPSGVDVPALWAVDNNSLALNWFWAGKADSAAALSAIATADLVYATGQIDPAGRPTIGGTADALFTSLTTAGQGLCPIIPDLIQPEAPVNSLAFEVETIQLPQPNEAGLDLLRGEPVELRACDTPNPCPGDTDGDGVVGLPDLLTVLANFGNAVPGGPADGDFNNNGTVDLTDLLLVLSNFGTVCP